MINFPEKNKLKFNDLSKLILQLFVKSVKYSCNAAEERRGWERERESKRSSDAEASEGESMRRSLLLVVIREGSERGGGVEGHHGEVRVSEIE